MMQHCQQVFAELNHGGVSVGAGGMMKTAFAPGLQAMQPPPQQMMGQPPMGQPPMGQPMMGAPQQAGFVPASPMQKTMIAQPSPFAGGMPQGGMPMQQPPMQQPGPGGFVQASPMQKTIVAGMAPPLPVGSGPQNPMMPPGMQHPGFPSQPPQSGPNKTVMLQSSDGVVSVARTGQALQPAGLAPGVAPNMGAPPKVVRGATPLFWIICLVTGIAVGVLAYVIVLQTS
jgi:phage shock protein PspC (stress-responsive transcriptional regulator)